MGRAFTLANSHTTQVLQRPEILKYYFLNYHENHILALVMIANKKHFFLIVLVFCSINLSAQTLLKLDTIRFPISFIAANDSLDPLLINFRMFSKTRETGIGLIESTAGGGRIFQLSRQENDSLVELGLGPSGFFYIIDERPIVDFETTERIEIEVHKVKFPRTVYIGFAASSVHYLIEIRIVRAEGTKSCFYSIVPKLWPKQVRRILKSEKAIERKEEEMYKSFK